VVTKVKRDEAEARFRSAQKRTDDRRKALTEQQEADQAIRERTARLRALRLAKEAADKEEAARLSLLKSAANKRGRHAEVNLEKATPKGSPSKQGGSQERE
jgi:hypothetical protein